MRLHNYIYLCKELKREARKLNTTEMATGNGTFYYLDNWEEYKKVLMELRKIPGLKKCIDDIYDIIPVFVVESQRPRIDKSVKEKLFTRINVLSHKMDAIIELGDSLGENEKCAGIDISIPKCDDIKQYISYLKDIEFIAKQCPYIQEDDANIEFKGTDVGSWWIVLGVVGGVAAVTAVLKNIAELVDIAMRVKSHFLSVKQQKTILAGIECEEKAKESYCELATMVNQQILKKEIESLANTDKLKDPEEVDKVVKALEKIVNLINNGGGIYTSIGNSREVQVLFPPIESGNIISEEIVKLLEDKQEASE